MFLRCFERWVLKMYCPTCGGKVFESDQFCRYCGKELSLLIDDDIIDKSGASIIDQTESTEQSGDYLYNQTRSLNKPSSKDFPEQKEYGLKWYYFVVKVQLWLTMLVLLYNAFQYFQGAHYGENDNAIYSTFPAIETVDLGFAIIMLIFVVFTFITRKSLARFEEKGVKNYLFLCYVLPLLSTIYSIVCCIAAKVPIEYVMDFGAFIVQVVLMLIYAIFNTIYFRKRKALFRTKRLQSTL